MSRHTFSLIGLLLALPLGCNSASTSSSPGTSDSPAAKYLLQSEPKDVMTPTEIKETVTEPTSLKVAGRIDAGEIEPFQKGIASFVISQLPDDSHAGGDPNHADNCPFCKRKLKNAPKAVVQFLDADGKVLQVDARELLGVAKGDVVVVQGTAQYLEAVNTVQINADGVFIR